MPTKDLSPKEFEELSKHIFDIEHRKGIEVLDKPIMHKYNLTQKIRMLKESSCIAV